MNKKDNFAIENLVRAINKNTNSIAQAATFGKGASLGTYHTTYLQLDNFTKPINDFIMLNHLKIENFSVSTDGEHPHTHTVHNPCYINDGDRVLCVEIGADVVVVGGVGNA
ncbi:MAG: hypothetical protein MSA56_14520 [Clostridium sp.]|nr:hypothetical protein [Clostridium sp.]